ncbi:MAG: DUF4465 domain-containing protein [Bacteroidales bacterium]|nr:DUF4465 domain-containing protein [Bacteroidales bacterium]
MKKILGFVALAMFCASCFKGAYYEASFVGLGGFNYVYSATEFPDSVLISPNGFSDAATYLSFSAKASENQDALYGGFAFSMKRDSSLVINPENKYPMLTVYTNPISPKSGSIVDGFIVYYDSVQKPEHAITYLEAANGTCAPNYFMVTNTQQVVKFFADRGYAQFAGETGDGEEETDKSEYLKLKVTGYLAGNKTGSAEYVLASSDSVNVAWKTLSLSKLGSIDTIDLELETKEGSEVPKYVCIDNIVAQIYIKK